MFGFFLQQNMKIGGSSKQSKYSELANLLLMKWEMGKMRERNTLFLDSSGPPRKFLALGPVYQCPSAGQELGQGWPMLEGSG